MSNENVVKMSWL